MNQITQQTPVASKPDKSNLKIILLVIVLVLVGIGLFQTIVPSRVHLINPQFIVKRNELAQLVNELSATPDVDLSSLPTYELNKNWTAAINLVDRALSANTDLRQLIKNLDEKVKEFKNEAQKLANEDARQKALASIKEFESGNEFLNNYFISRTELFFALRQYYMALAQNENPAVPSIEAYLSAININIAEAKNHYQAFSAKIADFDSAVGIK